MRKAQARAGQAKRRRDDIQAEVNDEAPMEIHGINVAKQARGYIYRLFGG
jgi:hypothetical protein